MEEIKKPNKYWWLLAVEFLFFVFLSGHVIGGGGFGSYGREFGYFLVPAVVSYFVIARAKTNASVQGGHVVFVLISLMFSWSNYQDALGDTQLQIAIDCSEYPRVTNSDLSSELKTQFCECFGEKLTTVIFPTLMKDNFLFRTTEPAESNMPMQERLNTVWDQCEAEVFY
jgi:hypothetical protein